MARYEKDHRETFQLLATSLDQLLAEDSVARAIRAGLDRLDFSAYDALYANDAVGRPAVDPRCLAGVWTLALLRGVTSSVRLAALCGRDLEFRWLLGDAPVEKTALCDFRKTHCEALASLSGQVLWALGQHGLLPAENMGVDGTIIRAASSRHAVKSRRRLEARQRHLEDRLRERLSHEDGGAPSEETQALERRRQRVARALEAMTARGLTHDQDRLTVSEPEAGLKRQKDGAFAPGYNAQVVTDLDSGAILHAEIVDAGNDAGQLAPQVERAKDALKEAGVALGEAPTVTADAAYHDTRQLDDLEKDGVACYVPEERNAHRSAPGVLPAYQADRFPYDPTTDTMTCPHGQCLKRRKLNARQTAAIYQAPTAACAACPAKPGCCPNSQSGRCVSRSLYTQTLDTVAQRLDTDAGRRKKHARWVVGEGAFARLNGLLHWGRCRMWGMAGAQAELLWRQFINNLLLLTRVWKPLIPAPEATP